MSLMNSNSALNFSVVEMVFGNGQLNVDFGILILSVLVFILNGFILLRQWPSLSNGLEAGPLKLSTLVDPLITAIVCPMTSDLYYIPEWGSGCSTTYTAVIASVIVILYASSLCVCYWLTELALPSSSDVSVQDKSSPVSRRYLLSLTSRSVATLGIAFLSSSAVNVPLTFILLHVVSNRFDVDEIFDSEICQPIFLFEMMLNVFVISVALQISYIGIYFYISRLNQSEQGHDPSEKIGHRFKSNMRVVILYALTTLLCLISVCFLRFIFITCSCKGLFELSKSLPTVTFLMTLKLPCAFTVNHFWPKKPGGE